MRKRIEEEDRRYLVDFAYFWNKFRWGFDDNEYTTKYYKLLLACYVLWFTNSSISAVAKLFNIPYSTLRVYIHGKLKEHSPELYDEVIKVVKNHTTSEK